MNDGQHSQMAYQSSETLKQEYESQGQGQGQADKTEFAPPAYQMPTHPSSPPTSASPFAFAPPPLSNMPGPGSSSRPSLMHTHHYSDGPYPKAQTSQPQQYPGGHPLPAYRNGSRPGVPGAQSPSMTNSQQTTSPRSAARQPNLNQSVGNASNPNVVPSPSGSSPYPPHYFQRQAPGPQSTSQYSSSPTLSHMGPPNGGPYGQMYRQPLYSPQEGQFSYAPSPSYVNHPDMPHSRSMPYSYLGSPSSFGTPGGPQPPHMLPSISAPSSLGSHGYGGHLPPLSRHQSSPMLPDSMSSVDLGASSGMGGRPPLLQTASGPITSGGSYSFANRLPLVDRPFKCDECVQSFNRNHDLKRHKRIHLSVKPFGCEKCGKTFSRKDALRRHWLVKGCRGEDGATAKISPTYPTSSAGPPPSLTPPTPTESYTSYPHDRAPQSFAHPGAPPPLQTLPPRQPSDQSTQILTPDDPQDGQSIQGLQEPVIISSASNSDMSQSAVTGDGDDGYFNSAANGKEGFQSYHPSSPSQKMTDRAHPYSRSPRSGNRLTAQSPARQSPISGGRYLSAQPLQQQQQMPPVFAVPFTPQSAQYMQPEGGLLVPQGEDMARQPSGSSSQGDDPAVWQRWHRPSFPFPPSAGNYNYAPTGPESESPREYIEGATVA